MTPNEIVREIVTRLQLGGGVDEDQLGCGEWRVRVMKGLCVYRFTDLEHVADAIRAVKPYPGVHIYKRENMFRGCVGDSISDDPSETIALTRALLTHLRANKIGEEHLAPEPEEPWIDVSESVSLATLPEDIRLCVVEFDDGGREYLILWERNHVAWKISDTRRVINAFRPKALGGPVIKWRYAK